MDERVDASLTPEEQAQIIDLQDRLIALFVDRGEAVDSGDRTRADTLQGEIDDLLQQCDHIKSWAAAGDGK